MTYVVPKRFETAQEIIDYVVPLLRKQGKPAVKSPPAVSCLYRGPDDTKCFAGFLINDADYNVELEGRPAVNLGVRLKLQVADTLHVFVDRAQMQIHDADSYDPAVWSQNLESRISRFCEERGLMVPPL